MTLISFHISKEAFANISTGRVIFRFFAQFLSNFLMIYRIGRKLGGGDRKNKKVVYNDNESQKEKYQEIKKY